MSSVTLAQEQLKRDRDIDSENTVVWDADDEMETVLVHTSRQHHFVRSCSEFLLAKLEFKMNPDRN